jgi:hypothetical protein
VFALIRGRPTLCQTGQLPGSGSSGARACAARSHRIGLRPAGCLQSYVRNGAFAIETNAFEPRAAMSTRSVHRGLRKSDSHPIDRVSPRGGCLVIHAESQTSCARHDGLRSRAPPTQCSFDVLATPDSDLGWLGPDGPTPTTQRNFAHFLFFFFLTSAFVCVCVRVCLFAHFRSIIFQRVCLVCVQYNDLEPRILATRIGGRDSLLSVPVCRK